MQLTPLWSLRCRKPQRRQQLMLRAFKPLLNFGSIRKFYARLATLTRVAIVESAPR